MSTAHDGPEDHSWASDPEKALKYALQRIEGGHAELIEGSIHLTPQSWASAAVVDLVREQIGPRLREMGLHASSGALDLPGTENYYVPDLAVVPVGLARTERALTPDQTLLVVDVRAGTGMGRQYAEKCRRYAQFRAPCYLLINREGRTWSLFSQPTHSGYEHLEGPHAFGESLSLPSPFDIEVETGEF